MTEDTVDQLERELTDQLNDLGLTDYEAHTLIGLVRLGTGTARDIARIDDVPRTRVYGAVETLHERGLVDIQYTTPRKFTAASRETIIRKLNTERENTIAEVGELLEDLDPVQRQQEQMGVWTVTGRDTVAERIFEFIDTAQEEIIYMTIDELLVDEHLDHLREAEERGAEIYLAGISDEVQERIQEEIPSAELFETLWEWSDTSAGSLLIADQQSALVSVLVDGHVTANEIEETAIWGAGDRNSLVVVLKAIFTWRLERLPDDTW